MARFCSFITLLLLSLSAIAQTQNIIPQAEEYVNAMINKDFNVVVELTHPEIIKSGGGIGLAIQDLEKEQAMLDDQEIIYQSGSVGKLGEIKQSENVIQTILPIHIDVLVKGSEYVSNSHLLATSFDNGLSWSFVNMEKFDANSLREFIPTLHPDLVIPLSLPYQRKDK